MEQKRDRKKSIQNTHAHITDDIHVNLVEFKTVFSVVWNDVVVLSQTYLIAPTAFNFPSINSRGIFASSPHSLIIHSVGVRSWLRPPAAYIDHRLRYMNNLRRKILLTKLSYMPGNVCLLFDRLPIHIRHVPSSSITYPFKCEPYFRIPNAPEYLFHDVTKHERRIVLTCSSSFNGK